MLQSEREERKKEKQEAKSIEATYTAAELARDREFPQLPKKAARKASLPVLEESSRKKKKEGDKADKIAENMDIEEETVAQAPKEPKMPPIVIEGTKGWQKVCQKIKEMKAEYTTARTVKDGIKIVPKTANDHRQITKMLNEEKRSYFSYILPEDKKLHVVVKGLPVDADINEVKEELREIGFDDAEVTRMVSRRTKEEMSMYIVKTNNKNIYKVDRLYNLTIRVEAVRKPRDPNQCYRCQRYGHGQSRCTFPQRCVKCSGPHAAKDCQLEKPSDGKRNAVCALCKGEHPANYKGCKEFPKPVSRTRNPAPKVTHASFSRGLTQGSYSDATKTGSEKTATTQPAPEPASRSSNLEETFINFMKAQAQQMALMQQTINALTRNQTNNASQR